MRASAGGRTALAWQRSAPVPLASTALLLAKQLGPAPGRVLLATANVLLALGIIWLGRRRDRRIRSPRTDSSGRITVSEAGREVAGVAVATVAIALGTVVLIVVGT